MKTSKTRVWIASCLMALLAANTMQAATYPEISFEERPGYLPNNSIALTFDDGPDWQNTARILDILQQTGVKATFFINAENWSSLYTDEPMRQLVRRMVWEGHELGNHGAYHENFTWLSDQAIEEEISSVERVVQDIFGASAPRLTLLRAPFGEPYQGNDPNNPSAEYQRVAPIVARHAVHMGWAIDSLDYECSPGDGNCVYNNVTGHLQTPGAGAYGVVLLHSVHAQTANALPGLIDYAWSRGFVFRTGEDVVRARYGQSSAQIVDGGGSTPPPGGPFENVNYRLRSRFSGRCLDVDAWSTINGGNLIQWDCHGGNNQLFRLQATGGGTYRLVNAHSHLCADVDGASPGNGANVHQWACHQGANQQVTIVRSADASYTVRFVHSGKCLDVSGRDPANGANVRQWECHGRSNQDWYFER